ncbi:hypothetical protein VPHK567_0314 [Vibrio phage K567]
MRNYSDLLFNVLTNGRPVSNTEIQLQGVTFEHSAPHAPITCMFDHEIKFEEDETHVIDMIDELTYVKQVGVVSPLQMYIETVHGYLNTLYRSQKTGQPVGRIVIQAEAVEVKREDMDAYLNIIGKEMVFGPRLEGSPVTAEFVDGELKLNNFNIIG